MPQFKNDHPLPALRGYTVPSWHLVKRACAKRCKYLDMKIGQRAALGEPIELLVEELASIVWLVEEIERRKNASVVQKECAE